MQPNVNAFFSNLTSKSLSRSSNLDKAVTKCIKRSASKIKNKQRMTALRMIFSYLIAYRSKVLLRLESAEKRQLSEQLRLLLLDSSISNKNYQISQRSNRRIFTEHMEFEMNEGRRRGSSFDEKPEIDTRFTCVDPAILLASLEKEVAELTAKVKTKMNEKHRFKAQLKDLKKEDLAKSEIISELTSTMELLQRTISSASPLPAVHHVINPSLPVTPPYTPTSSFVTLPSSDMPTTISPTSSSTSVSSIGSTASTPIATTTTTTTTTTTATTFTTPLVSSLTAQIRATSQSLPSTPVVVPSAISGAALACFKQQSNASGLVATPMGTSSPISIPNRRKDSIDSMSPVNSPPIAPVVSPINLSSPIMSPVMSPVMSPATSPRGRKSPRSPRRASLAPRVLNAVEQIEQSEQIDNILNVEVKKKKISAVSNPTTNPTLTNSGGIALPASTDSSPSSSDCFTPPAIMGSGTIAPPSPGGGTMKRAIADRIRDRMKVFEKKRNAEETDQDSLAAQTNEAIQFLQYFQEPDEDVDPDRSDEPPMSEEKPPDINKTITAPSLKKTFYGKKGLLALFFEDKQQNPNHQNGPAGRDRSHSLSLLESMLAPKQSL
eukprot:TRINITY_DN5677_c0_g1_i1.p1 TRINITY_DN5677_c0_g1~~TRINITY_DN5677_c0_g1_i1.p1  ORF type:complete len:606 (+),score=113.70 TRINITY_DN5677_c0_g1_i1:1-1818(+)